MERLEKICEIKDVIEKDIDICKRYGVGQELVKHYEDSLCFGCVGNDKLCPQYRPFIREVNFINLD